VGWGEEGWQQFESKKGNFTITVKNASDMIYKDVIQLTEVTVKVR
jgi:hypothetical protein